MERNTQTVTMPETTATVVVPGKRAEEGRVEPVRRGKDMFTKLETLQEFEALLKVKRNIKTNITNRIKMAEQDLAESSTDRPERLATAAATYFRGMIDLKGEELVLDKKATDNNFLLILAVVEEIQNIPETGAQQEEWVR